MEIKTLTKLVEVPYDIYVSADGKEFKDKDACFNYELRQKKILKDCWNNAIHKIEVEPCTLGYNWDSEDYYDYVFEIRSEMDIAVLNGMLKFYGNIWYDKPFTNNDIGKKYVASLEYSDDIMDGNDICIFEYEPLWQKLCDTHNKVEAFFKQEI